MLASFKVVPKSSHSISSLVRPRAVLEENDNDYQPTISTISNKKVSAIDNNSPAKKRRLNEEDLIAREELDSDDDWEANDRFDVIGHLGNGMFGVVYKAIDRNRDNEIVAVKKITFQLNDYDQMPICVVREIANLRYLQRTCCDLPIIRYVVSIVYMFALLYHPPYHEKVFKR